MMGHLFSFKCIKASMSDIFLTIVVKILRIMLMSLDSNNFSSDEPKISADTMPMTPLAR